MFLFVSGLLYGRKDKIDVVEFYKKSFPKLLVDYYVFIIVMLMVIHWSPLMHTDRDGVIGLLTFSKTIPGFGHLWFIPTILFCYLMVPVFSEIVKAIDAHRDVRFFGETVILICVTHFLIKYFFGYFKPAWINCFVIGMIYSRTMSRELLRKVFNILVVISCLVITPIRFRMDYLPHGELPKFLASRYSHFVQYGHVFLGIALVLFIRYIYNCLFKKDREHYVLNWSDKYSYDVYLTHHIFVQSAVGCVEFISNRFIAIPLAIAFTIVASVILYAISSYARRGLALFAERFLHSGDDLYHCKP